MFLHLHKNHCQYTGSPQFTLIIKICILFPNKVSYLRNILYLCKDYTSYNKIYNYLGERLQACFNVSSFASLLQIQNFGTKHLRTVYNIEHSFLSDKERSNAKSMKQERGTSCIRSHVLFF